MVGPFVKAVLMKATELGAKFDFHCGEDAWNMSLERLNERRSDAGGVTLTSPESWHTVLLIDPPWLPGSDNELKCAVITAHELGHVLSYGEKTYDQLKPILSDPGRRMDCEIAAWRNAFEILRLVDFPAMSQALGYMRYCLGTYLRADPDPCHAADLVSAYVAEETNRWTAAFAKRA